MPKHPDLDPAQFDVAEPDEFAFVYDSWARSFKKSPWAGCVSARLWPQVSRESSAEIVSRAGAQVLVAYTALADGTRRVMGYSVSEPRKRVLHWLFMKKDYRGYGYGSDLLRQTCGDERGWTYTHRTRASTRFLGTGFVYDATPARIDN